MSELASFINTTPSSLQRELRALAESGILRSRRDGNRLYYQAETESPIFAALRELLTQTLGITQSLKESLTPLSERITSAFIYGSLARGEEQTLSDVDLIVIGSVGLAELSPILRESERKFGREINATCYSVAEFQEKIRLENHFLSNILKQEKIFLVGENHELERLAEESDSAKTHDEPSGNRKPARSG